MTTDQKGAIAESAIVHAAAKLGIPVAKPLSDVRYDLVFDLGFELLRVQCKWALRRGDIISVVCYSSRRSANGFLKYAYTPDEIDAIAAYCADVDRCFLPLDVFGQRMHIQLRLAPTKNNQHARINWADEYDFAATLNRRGAVAQLGERRAGSAKATGSNPVGSIPVSQPGGDRAR